ncbi:MAG: hypothetical protein LKK00_09380 [Intestinimonas sp.]|jgi:hypothetical protein|nr:hypothetical protein [Intestinimonas sp.]
MKEDAALQNALERIRKIAAFRVCYIEDTAVEAEYFKDHGALSYSLEDGSYILCFPRATIRQNIIRATDQIESRYAIASGNGVNKTIDEEGRA